ncbi:tyrosine-type recombinase/integrase [Dietzia maris]
MVRNRRSGVEDLWTSKATGQPTRLRGKGMRWRARYVDDDGRETTKRFARKRDAESWLDQTTADLVTGTYVQPAKKKVLVQDLAEGWYGTKSELKPKTLEGYRGLLDTLVLPKWGGTPVGDVTHEGVQAWISEMRSSGVRDTEKGLSPSRTIQAYQALRGVLDYAVKRRHIAVNPALGVELPRKVAVERRYLTHRQVEDLAAKMGEWRLLTLVLAYTGLRWGEAVALRARRVDLDRGRIEVSESVTRVGRELVVGPPKSHAHRSVPVPAFLVEELRPLIEELDEDELVFESPIGGYLTSWTYRSKFDGARPYKEMTPHDLRHTAASLAIQAGANIKAVQRMLGHASATLTLDRYGHLFDDDLDHLAANLSESRAYSLRTEGEKKKIFPIRNMA